MQDLFDMQGKKQMKVLFENEIKKFEKLLGDMSYKYSELESMIKALTDKERWDDILTKYRNLMRRNLQLLNVYSLSEESYKNIDTTVKECGSATPRALMAYYYSILHLMNSHGSSSYCPIIIDSPNQQGQDSENLPKLLRFILDYQPHNSQLILGLEDIHNVESSGAEVIELREKGHLLQTDEYESVYSEMKFYLDKSIL